MAKECGCPVSKKTCGIVILVVGLLYLASDLKWISWWTLNWYTVAFLMVGLCKLFHKK